MDKHKLAVARFARVGKELLARGIKVNTGTIGAPSPTKNADKARDPEMHQTRKGQQWYFGMKLHTGLDSPAGLAHSAVVTPANVHDKYPLPSPLHGQELRVYGDSAYVSQKTLIAAKAPQAQDFTNQRARWAGGVDEVHKSKNRNKSRIRARVEHVFGVAKRLWGFGKVRYRGLLQDPHEVLLLFYSTNGLSALDMRVDQLWGCLPQLWASCTGPVRVKNNRQNACRYPQIASFFGFYV